MKLPRQPGVGELVLVRAKLRHPMETGWRVDASGDTVPRNRVYEVRCDLDGDEMFRAEPHAGVSTETECLTGRAVDGVHRGRLGAERPAAHPAPPVGRRDSRRVFSRS